MLSIDTNHSLKLLISEEIVKQKAIKSLNNFKLHYIIA